MSGTGNRRELPFPPAGQRVVSELGLLLLSEHSLDDVMATVARLAKDTIGGADEVSVTLVRDGKAHTAAFTGEPALGLDERQYEDGYGPCLSAAAVGKIVRIDDTAREETYRAFAEAAEVAGIGSTFSVGMPIPQGTLGAINCYSHDAHAFGAEDRDNASSVAGAAAVALANAALYSDARQLAEQMQEAMQSRAVIEQAKGILIRDNRCTADEAFTMLVQASNRSNRKLHTIAHALVDATARGA